MNTQWRGVLSVEDHIGGRKLLRLTCGHTTKINPVPSTESKLREQLESTVPCPTCGNEKPRPATDPDRIKRRIDMGLREAEREELVQMEFERTTGRPAFRGDEIVRARKEYL